MLNPVDLDGEPTLVEVATPDIKLRDKPTLVIAIPCGDKTNNTVLTCPKHLGGCGQKYVVPGMRTPLLAPIRFNMKIQNLVKPLNMVTATLVEGGRLSSEARQIMTKKAIRMGARYILYIDDDTIPPEDGMGLYIMINFLERNPTIGAVSGVVPTRVNPPEPVVYQTHGEGAFWDLPMGPGAVPQPIFGSGAAFLLARVDAIASVIETLKAENGGVEVPVWADQRAMPGELADAKVKITHMFGHDMRFCYLMNTHGFPVYAHGQVMCGHLDTDTDTIFYVPDDAPGRLGPRDLPKLAVEAEDGEKATEVPSVEIIMVKYKLPEYEARTLEAVEAHTRYPNYTVRTHENPKGVPLSKCWNDLIRTSNADYVCLLNSDTCVTENWLTKMMAAVVLSNVGAVVPSSNAVHMSEIDTTLQLFEFDKEKINAFAASLPAEPHVNLPLASCMCAVFSKDTWHKVGGFDEDFILYGEDTEFFWRMTRRLKKAILWVKDAYVHHYKAQSTNKARETEGLDIEALRANAMKLLAEKTDLEVVQS